MSVDELLQALRDRQISLNVRDDKLKLVDPGKKLTPELTAALKANKHRLLEILQRGREFTPSDFPNARMSMEELEELERSMVGLVLAPFDGYCSTDVLVLRAREGVDPRFAARLFQTEQVHAVAEATAIGTKMPRTSWNDLRRIRVFCPFKKEQSKVAGIVDTLDTAIRQTESIIEKLRQVKQGLLHDLLTRGIDKNGELRPPQTEAPHLYEPSPLGWIPKAWTVRRLSQCFPLQRGFDITKDEQLEGDVPVISSSGVASYHAVWRCMPPGVVIGRKGKLGGAYYVDKPYWPHDTTLWVTNFFGNEPEFCRLLLVSLRLERFDAATSVPTLNRNVIHPLNVAMPCVDEQRLIVQRISNVDASFGSESTKLCKARELKSGLMDDLLTGRVRVTPLLKE